jgi:hypothetical protein
MSKFMDHLKERFKALPAEVGDMLVQKTAHGAAEAAHALNSQSNSFVPYGTGQAPLEVEGPQQSYQDMLRDVSARGQEHDQGLDR